MLFDNIKRFFKKANKKEKSNLNSKDAAKERLHLVLMQDRANVSADFLDLMRQEIIEVIKKYIDVDESAIDVRLTNQANEDGTQGAPALYANIPIVNIKDENKKIKQESEKNNEEEKNEKDEQEDITTESEQEELEQEDSEKNEINDESAKEEEEIKKIEEAKKIVEEENKIAESEKIESADESKTDEKE